MLYTALDAADNAPYRDIDRPSSRSELQGVGDQIPYDLVHFEFVHIHAVFAVQWSVKQNEKKISDPSPSP